MHLNCEIFGHENSIKSNGFIFRGKDANKSKHMCYILDISQFPLLLFRFHLILISIVVPDSFVGVKMEPNSPGRSPFHLQSGRHRSCCLWFHYCRHCYSRCWTRQGRSLPADSQGKEVELEKKTAISTFINIHNPSSVKKVLQMHSA